MSNLRKKLLKVKISWLLEIAENLHITIPDGSDKAVTASLLSECGFAESVEEQVDKIQRNYEKVKKDNLLDFLRGMKLQSLKLLTDTLNIIVPASSSRSDIISQLHEHYREQVVKELNNNRARYIEEYIFRHQQIRHPTPILQQQTKEPFCIGGLS
ncbi:hypothetical protein PPL_01541 [Heterostelium album PN500]|uniref:Uncharacterized protein n=1 Tax=Heterostelium pallidum (strain ATCC 26659 / Pp 5 / PN500) TaxID=670386 RepID=D3AZS8_HETP5|nr:hypothetical protein PPL_01541 [Heterostelium album PN500]EFA84552.1 hypothetical protein PPL_01541 [Heterostelium album PN500]|eukprot:XP_020436665.1 hypothetical protein PPL_01541 [Heterostelium album PN500]